MMYAKTWKNPSLTTQARTIDEMARGLEEAARQLRQMERNGVTLDPGSGMLVTHDLDVAQRFGFDLTPLLKFLAALPTQY